MKKTTDVDVKNPASPVSSFLKVIDGLSALKKRTVRVKYLLDSVDSQRLIYPNGVFGFLKEDDEETRQVRRIEIFAEDQSGETYGIIRNLFVAYSSELSLLELALVSNSVISVRAFCQSSQRGTETKLIEDKLILKRTDYASESTPYSARAPSLLVSSRWLDRMNLARGDRIIISNPIENYAVPPPNMAEALKS